MFYYIFAGFAAGIISGMGIGGGTILIPALTFISNFSQQEIQNMNLIYFVPTAITAIIIHQKNNNIETKILKPLIFFGLCGALAGSLLAIQMESGLLRKLFGGFLLIMGILEIRKKA